jgi:mannose-6-phosphate isomerase
MTREIDLLVRGPIFFEPNRVTRTYRGGRLLGAMRGRVEEDGDRPEEWIASTVRARVDQPAVPEEGLSTVEGTGMLFETLLRQRSCELLGSRTDFGVLVKLIDSSIRLAVQVHPDREFARDRFGSPSGKTEMWIVVAVRPGASLLIGLRQGVERETVAAAIGASEADRSAVVSLLNEVPARPGDVWLLPGRLPHAIGAGCLILELQEPTDLTFRFEAWSGERRLSDFERFAGLGLEAALDCVNFDAPRGEQVVALSLQEPAASAPGSSGRTAERLVDRRVVPDFGASRYRLPAGSRRDLVEKPSIVVVTRGSGTLAWGRTSRRLATGDYFFLPCASSPLSVTASTDLELIECLPPA